jgi:methyl-accepting chemotaxis protein
MVSRFFSSLWSARGMPTIKMTFTFLTGLSVAAGVVTALSVIKSRSAAGEEAAAYEMRYNSYLLADELRQSSDDLTRLGRTYVVTGDASYKNQYIEILAIRNGEKPRPEAYNRVYWDFVAGGAAKPRPDESAVPLLSLMKKQGFTDAEFQQLEEAKKNSDGLVNLEVEAMNLVEGKDKSGNALASPDRSKAIELVHSKQYHIYKAQIMTPIDRFFTMLDKRTQSAIDMASASGTFWNAVLTASISGLVALVLLLCGYVYFFVVKGLFNIENVSLVLSGGNTETAIEGIDRVDEIGSIARSLQNLRDSLKVGDRLRAEQDQERAAQAVAAGRSAEMFKRADMFEATVGGIVETMSAAFNQLEGAASTLTSTAESTQKLSIKVASASEEASANVRSVASASKEMSSSVDEIGRRVHESARIAGEAVEQAQQTNDRVNALSEAANRIGDVVELINTIAGQTNLLALNATIEAARAGDAGRGFAVVASEVKMLAEQTAKATGEIGQQIASIQSATQESVVAIKEISLTIGRISEISSAIAAAIEEQGAATREISRNVQQAAQGTQDVASNISDVKQGASETGSASSQVLSAAQSLSSESNRLKLEVGNFLEAVRAA